MQVELANRCRFRSALLAIIVLAGCHGEQRVSVTGRVTRRDGSPVVGCRVSFRSPSSGKSASGVTNDRGYYELGAVEKGDGILPGEYAIAVTEDRGDWDHPKPRTIHPRYESANTSGLTHSVDPATQMTFDLELDGPPPNAR